MISPLVEATLTVAFGALAGGVTNTVAIWMLFHPYEPPRLGGRPIRLFQGAIPKNRERLARAMGRTVGERLLTGEDLARAVAEPTFRAAFEERLDAFLGAALEVERPSLAELLPPPVLEEVRELADDVARAALDRLEDYLESDEFRDSARRWTRELIEAVRDRPVEGKSGEVQVSSVVLLAGFEQFEQHAVSAPLLRQGAKRGFGQALGDGAAAGAAFGFSRAHEQRRLYRGRKRMQVFQRTACFGQRGVICAPGQGLPERP